MTEKMRKRVRDIHARAAVRRWEYRQRDRAKGVWFRLRRELTRARAVYVLSAAVADALERERANRASVGDELHPKRKIFWVTDAELDRYRAGIEEIAINLDLLARPDGAWALVPFDTVE